MGYKVVPLDLSAAAEQIEVVPAGTRVRSVLVSKLDAGAQLKLRFGSNQYMTIGGMLSASFDDVDADDDENAGGVYAQIPAAQPGVTAEIVVITTRRRS